MAGSPKRLCGRPGCGALVTPPERYCPTHAESERKLAAEADARRGTRTKRGYTNAWTKASIGYRRKNPWCVICKRAGRMVPSECVDHIKPHGGDQELFWDKTNWQALCGTCHSEKTAREDGGFGNRRER